MCSERSRTASLTIILLLTMSLFSCAGTPPTTLGINDGHFSSCPETPNCVSSDAPTSDQQHHIDPITYSSTSDDAWHVIQTVVTEIPRTRIVKQTPNYIHAECTSAIMGFVDDLELHLREDKNQIAVRSASRLGHSDLGVNRKRVERIRDLFLQTQNR